MTKPELEGQLPSFPEKSHTVQGSTQARVYELAGLLSTPGISDAPASANTALVTVFLASQTIFNSDWKVQEALLLS